MDEIMKIEKLNENQIRCILSKTDLESRNINASELAYGSDKANMLFKEMTQQASKQFGFKTNNTPLMVEAVPLEDESIALIITKVEDPEELDTRFSRFTPDKSDENDEMTYKEKINKANELLGFLNSFREILSENSGNNIPSSQKEIKDSTSQITLVFQFDNIEQIIKLSYVLKNKYHGNNSLYRHNNVYYLAIQKEEHTPEEFNQICNIICEYAGKPSFSHISEAHMQEHFELILKGHALQDLNEL